MQLCFGLRGSGQQTLGAAFQASTLTKCSSPFVQRVSHGPYPGHGPAPHAAVLLNREYDRLTIRSGHSEFWVADIAGPVRHLAPPRPEEGLELEARRFSVASAGDHRTVMAGRLLEEPGPMEHSTTLRVFGREDQTRHPGQADSANTHPARLKAHIKSSS